MTKTSKKDQAITALITTTSIKAAAARVGVNEKTIRRWLDDPEFAHKVNQAQIEVMQGTIRGVINAGNRAVETLLNIMGSDEYPASARVSAAKAVINNNTKILELQTVQQTLEEFESAIERMTEK